MPTPRHVTHVAVTHVPAGLAVADTLRRAPDLPDRSFSVAVPLLVLGIALGACRQGPDAVADGDDPLAALRVSVQSTRYTDQWWQQQAGANPALWRQAVEYCGTPGVEADGPKPNCGFVQLAANRLQVDSIAKRGVRTEDASEQVDRNAFKP